MVSRHHRKLDISRLGNYRNSIVLLVTVILPAIFIHGQYVTYQMRQFALARVYVHNASVPINGLSSDASTIVTERGASTTSPIEPNIPDLFIFRRTKKTGSSSMLDAIITELKPMGYHALYFSGSHMDSAVHGEYSSPTPRKLLVAEHNHVTKNYHPRRNAVIADTVRDGYKQMTSYCRYVKGVRECAGKMMMACLKEPGSLKQNWYRYAEGDKEDSDNYIDLPLSSEYPALSTTIFRNVYPNATLQVDKYNSQNSTCPEISRIRRVYSKNYKELDTQIERLQKRMIVLAGYPYTRDRNVKKSISIEDMLREAEKREEKKYAIIKGKALEQAYSDNHKVLIATLKHWTRNEKGELYLTYSRAGRQQPEISTDPVEKEVSQRRQIEAKGSTEAVEGEGST